VPAPLVTGAAGFAGRYLVEHLLEHEPAVAAWSNPGGTPPDTTDTRVAWSSIDLLDAPSVERALAALRPTTIYHCAGIADVGGSWTRPQHALWVNAVGTHRLIEAVRRAGLTCPILVTGSALVYRPSLEPITEAFEIGPATPYGVSKLAQEMLAEQVTFAPTFLTRPFNHAGPRQSDAYVTSSFARQIARIEAGLSAPELLVGNLDARRDITDVRDVVRAYRLLVERGQPRRVYNVCSGVAHRVGDLLELMIGLARARVTVSTDPAKLRPSDNPVVLGDCTRIADETGWRPEIPIERTLADLLDYWRRHPSLRG
jgi:GDP-4-dehydro-6-deoxy-D-mannose reductase